MNQFWAVFTVHFNSMQIVKLRALAPIAVVSLIKEAGKGF